MKQRVEDVEGLLILLIIYITPIKDDANVPKKVYIKVPIHQVVLYHYDIFVS